MASSFDQVGCFTKTVADARLILEWISGSDGYDSNASGSEFRVHGTELKGNLKGVKVGVPKEYFSEGLDKGVEKVIREAINKMKELGAEIVEISLPHSDYALAAYYILVPSEVSSNMARFDGIRFGSEREDFGDEVKRRIMLGTFALSTGYYDDYFAKAAKVRTLIKQDFEEAFTRCDVIVGPVSPTVAWNIGEKTADPLKMYLSDIYTISVNLAGLPALSVPCGFSDSMPVGLHVIGKYMDEETILDLAEVYENSTTWHEEKPKL
jgi:aspartyl-tRNA(Asn)/glutamyl-tRNA(Gln) amidotransferase subunit A